MKKTAYALKKITTLVLCLVLFFGCASVHRGQYAVQIDSKGEQLSRRKKGKTELDLVISGIENTTLASQYFGVIDFTFENLSQEWIKIKSIKADFGDEKINKNVKFTSGKDIPIWHEAIKIRNTIDDFNTRTILGGLAGFGAGLAAYSNNKDLQKIGAMTAVGAVTSLSAYEFNKQLDKIEKTKIFPKNHLFTKDFIIPPGLFVKKWLLVNSKNHKEISYIHNIFIEYQTEEGKTEKIKLDFRFYEKFGSIWSQN